MTNGKKGRLFLISSGVILAISLAAVRVFNYSPNTSVAFPLIPPPSGFVTDYIATNTADLETAIQGHYGALWDPLYNAGQTYVIRNVTLTPAALAPNAFPPCVLAGFEVFIAQYPDDVKVLKVGDKVDILCVYAGPSKSYSSLNVFTNAIFILSGVDPLPLPGGAAVAGGY